MSIQNTLKFCCPISDELLVTTEEERVSMGLKQQQLRELSAMVDVTTFANYRDYLDAIYQGAKALKENYSYVQLSDDLGLASTNGFAMIHGTRKLSEKIAIRIADKLFLSAKQKKYLLGLVRQAHAKTSDTREQGFQDQLEIAKLGLSTELDRRRLLFFEHWYHAAIIELMRIDGASDDPKWIASNLNPKVPLNQVKASLELLQDLHYLKFDAVKKRLFPTEETISTGDRVERLAIMSYHRQMLDLAVTAMDRIDEEKRDISAITVSVSESLRTQMIEELIALRKRFLQLSAAEPSPTDIVQCNMQLFSMVQSKTTSKRGAK